MTPIVGIRHGKLRGELVGGISVFRGIPYAAPISGPALFAAPGPVEPWEGVREATAPGATVPKPPYEPPFDRLLNDPVVTGDEALNLNVWTPDPGGSGLPVMVWIHGGAFRNGSGSVPSYDGTKFARNGVVLVTINYRLGAPGFAAVPDAPANRGVLDQLAALAWVQEHIAAFGGDPGQVTIFGESAGGMSVGTLVSIAAEQGLFRRGIAQSGAGQSVAAQADAELVSAELAARLGVPATAEGFATVDPRTLIETQQSISRDAQRMPDPARWGESVVRAGMAFLPVVDGELITQRPVDAVAAGAGRDIELLIGATTDEYRFFLTPLGITDGLPADGLRSVAAARGMTTEVVDRYVASSPDASPGDVLAALITDSYFWIPAIRLAEQHARAGGTNYHYEFAWPSADARFGACHTLDVPFVFDNLDTVRNSPLFGPNPPQPLADAVQAAWISFARTGNPGWARYDLDRRPVLTFNHPERTVVDDPRADLRKLWDNLV